MLRDLFPRVDTDAASARQQAASDNAYAWLVSQMSEGGLLDSYEDNDDIAYTYDQAVAAIAFLAKNDIARATRVLDALGRLQRNDGAWHTAYYCGSRAVCERQQHVGPVLWIALAVACYEKVTGSRAYREMALDAIRWSLQFQQHDGGINGGLDADGNAIEWSSTEHNEDAYAALTYFGYPVEASTVKFFLDYTLWHQDERRFLGGRGDARDPLDVNSWGAIALDRGPHPYGAALDYAMRHHRRCLTQRIGDRELSIDGFDFDSDKDDIWFEGQGEMAVALKSAGRLSEANYFIDETIKLQEADGGTGVRYSLKGTHNGYWTMASSKSVSATSWLIFAIHGVNPLRP